MKFLIIGLGIYGANLAKDLTALGHEVIAADVDSNLVEPIKDLISTAYIIDSTDEMSLSVLPLNNVDIVIVAIGENFGASIKTVALLKKLKVKHLYARAIDSLHQSILEGIGVDCILTPEQRAARDLVNEMELGSHVDSLRIDADNFVMKFDAPDFMIGMKYSSLNLLEDYSLILIAVTRITESKNVIGILQKRNKRIDLKSDPSLTVEKGDQWICAGSSKGFNALSTISD